MIGASKALALLGASLLICALIATVVNANWNDEDKLAYHCQDQNESDGGGVLKPEYANDQGKLAGDCKQCCMDVNFKSGNIQANKDNGNKRDCFCQQYDALATTPLPPGTLRNLPSFVYFIPKLHTPQMWCRKWDYSNIVANNKFRGHVEERIKECTNCFSCTDGISVFLNGHCGCISPHEYLETEPFFTPDATEADKKIGWGAKDSSRAPSLGFFRGALNYVQNLGNKKTNAEKFWDAE